MKLKDFDFRVWYSESLLYANKEHLFLGYSQRECGEVIQVFGEQQMHAYHNGEPLCPDSTEIEFYTGFMDSNKLDKVFVGDIIKYSWCNQEKIGKVVDWEFNNCCGFNVTAKGEFLPLGVIEILEILGNIHENPELLGGEK